jgi:zinc protease
MLPNGLRIVVVEHHRRPVVLVRLVLPRGALADPRSSLGATHLGVQIASDFHERSERGEDLVGERSFRRQVTELGGSTGFWVDPDHSVVGISGYAQDAGKYLDMLGDAVTWPRRGAESFASRREALLAAVEDLESVDPEALSRVLAEAAFGPGHPYARPVLGTAATLEPLGLEDAVAQQEVVFVPRGATLLVVGDVGAERIFGQARAAFSRWRRRSPEPPLPIAGAGPPAAAEVVLLRRQPASTLVACASRPLADVPGADAALDVLAAWLGEGSASRLAAVLRDGGGLTYEASAAVVRRRHARAFLACSALAADRAEAGVRLFRETLESARASPPTAAELERARSVLLARLEAAGDDAAGSADLWLEAIALGRPGPLLDREREALARVTASEVHQVARAVLRPDRIRWVFSGDPRVAAAAVGANRLGPLRSFSFAR